LPDAGSSLLTTEEEAVAKAEQTGYPVLLKATGGGGGIGIYACPDTEAVRQNFAAAGRCAAHHICIGSGSR
jgi:urea carboxylase